MIIFWNRSQYFRMFCSKRSIAFENMYQLNCWFRCVDIFSIKFRFWKTYEVANSVNRILSIKTMPNVKTIKEVKCWFTSTYTPIEEVILSLQSSSKKLFQRLLDDQMKINAESVTVTFWWAQTNLLIFNFVAHL